MKRIIPLLLLLSSSSYAYLGEGFGDLFSALRSALHSPKQELQPLVQQKDTSSTYNHDTEKKKHYQSTTPRTPQTPPAPAKKRELMRLFLCGE